MKKHLIPVLLVFIGLATLSFTTAVGIKLRLKPQQGKSYTITSNSSQTTTMKIQGQSMTSSQRVEGRQTFTVKESTATASVFETQLEAIKMTTSVMGMELTYDSEHPEKTNPMIADQVKEYNDIIKQTNTLTFNELGVIESESDIAMNQLGNVIIELPEEELHVGSQWSTTTAQSASDVEFSVTMTYTVTSISKKSVDLSFTGATSSATYMLTGTYNGTASIDPQTGMIMNSTTKAKLSMTISEQDVSIPMTIEGTTTIEVK